MRLTITAEVGLELPCEGPAWRQEAEVILRATIPGLLDEIERIREVHER